jgi:hypothetical protein
MLKKEWGVVITMGSCPQEILMMVKMIAGLPMP